MKWRGLFIIFFLCFGGGVEAKQASYEINTIIIEGNRITRDEIIYRELLFREGDTLSLATLEIFIEKSRENLINTSLFNFVIIEKVISPADNNVIIMIRLVERWYIWPVPIFEHAERNLPSWLRDPDFKQLNYGLQLNWNNFRGRRELLQFKARLGYKEQFMLQYTKPNIDKDHKHGIGFGLNSFRQHELVVRSSDNEPVYVRNDDIYLYEDQSGSFSYYYRPGYYVRYQASIDYTNVKFRDEEFHSEYLGTDFGDPLRWFAIRLTSEFDYRDNKIYPLEGYFFKLRLEQRGLGIIKDFDQNKTVLTFIGSSHQAITSRFHFENHLKTRLMKNEVQPYIFREGLGFSTYLRGFEYYVIEGNSYFINVNNLKYTLIPMHTHTFKLIPWEQFNKIHYSVFSNLFFDMAYIRDKTGPETENRLQDKLLYSAGIGFDLVTYYDQVFRLEFTLNSLREFGIYFHVETPFNRW